jgi:hypothetical protein
MSHLSGTRARMISLLHQRSIPSTACTQTAIFPTARSILSVKVLPSTVVITYNCPVSL